MSLSTLVPADVPSLVHSSVPVAASEAAKKSRRLMGVSDVGAMPSRTTIGADRARSGSATSAATSTALAITAPNAR
jgi:hypothetical protein